MEERQLRRLRQWAGTTEKEVVKDKETASFYPAVNSGRSVRMSPSKPSSLYPSLKGLLEELPSVTLPTELSAIKKLEPMEREKIAISRLGWNRDLSSVRQNRCRTDASLMSAAFLSKYYFLGYFYF